MTNAPSVSSQALVSPKSVVGQPYPDSLALVGRLLAQYEEDLSHADHPRAQLVNTAILEQCRFLEPYQTELVNRQLERIMERAWGCCFR